MVELIDVIFRRGSLLFILVSELFYELRNIDLSGGLLFLVLSLNGNSILLGVFMPELVDAIVLDVK